MFENRAGSPDWIFDTAKAGDGTCAQRRGVHDDGVAFDVSIEVQVRAVPGVEDRIILENSYGRFDSIERVAATCEDGIALVECAETTGLASFDGVVGDVPGAAVNDKRWRHAKKE